MSSRGDRLLQKVEQHAQPWATFGLVLHQGRCARCLAEILLHQAQQPLAIAGNHPVEALDHQHPMLAKRGNLRLEHGQAKAGAENVITKNGESGAPREYLHGDYPMLYSATDASATVYLLSVRHHQ